MARCLIIGCGCRGRALATELRARGHVVRGTTRDADRVAEIEAAGAEGVVGDPDRLMTLTRAFDHVAVAYVLLGSAVGSAAQLHALHAERLEAMVFRMLDTTIHGVIYESAGSVDPELLASGGALVQRMCDGSRIPCVLLDADPTGHAAWVRAAAGAADTLLAP